MNYSGTNGLRYFTIFSGAFLLFQVQPIIARLLLPIFGGSTSVWTGCMLFFQLMLLAGYAYAHGISRLSRRGRLILHSLLILLALISLPGLTRVPAIPLATHAPVVTLLKYLLTTIGIPYFLLSTTSSLVQSWMPPQRQGKPPYHLYSLSNIASLGALLTYPFLVEPAFSLQTQIMLWSLLFIGYSLGKLGCLFLSPPTQPPPDIIPARAPLPPMRIRLHWFGLTFTASLSLLAYTNQLCQGIAAIPFLWLLPLSLYLLTFVLAFASHRYYSREILYPSLLFLLVFETWITLNSTVISLGVHITVLSLLLFGIGLLCHGELYRHRPAPQHLTLYYLIIALGGAGGGTFCGLLAPILFNDYLEFHLSLWLGGLILIGLFYHDPSRLTQKYTPRTLAILLVGYQVALTLLLGYDILQQRQHYTQIKRNFFGVTKVEIESISPQNTVHKLIHGHIVHGLQVWPDNRLLPTTYYGPASGAGYALTHHPKIRTGQTVNVGIIGLGIGTLTVYAHAGDDYRYYEINPAVIDLANSPYFSYLRHTQAQLQIVTGDGRLALTQELRGTANTTFDIMVLDAFSDDAIPVHLLTREAFGLYLKHLRDPDSLLAVHISNKHLNLRPVLLDAARYWHRQAYLINTQQDGHFGTASTWVVLSATPLNLPALTGRRIAWTDQYSDLWSVMNRDKNSPRQIAIQILRNAWEKCR